jgi:hypothetical protein
MKFVYWKLHCIIIIFILGLFPHYGFSQVKSVEPNWETMKYGLFVHFVYGGEYGGMTPLGKTGGFPANIDEFAENFDVQKFANDVQAMGFEYVIFTAWHANMGVLYPSKVMADYGFDQNDHFTSQRDLLGEIIDSLAVRDIKFSIYTHIFVGHDFHPQGSGYYMYDNRNGIKTQDMINSGYVDAVEGNPQKWNDFINAVFDEMSTRYGEKVCAYWFDGTWVPNSWVDKQRMMQTIEKTNKICAFVANGTPSHGLPYSSKEVGSPAGNDYGFNSDYPPVYNNDVKTWPTYTRNIALIQGGNWWASTSGKPKFSAETIYRFTVLEAGTNTGGGVSWAFSPFVNGDWEGDMLSVMTKAYSYLKPVEEAIKNTNPSTSFVTKEGTKISTLSNGYVATRSADGGYEYLHVLNSRKENFLKLPPASDSRVYDSAYLVKNNKPLGLKLDERGYLLTLPDGEKWDTLNTVIRLRLCQFSVTASAVETRLRNPWKGMKLGIIDESGNRVVFSIVNDSIVFASVTSKKYTLSVANPPIFKSGKVDNHADTVSVGFSEPLLVPGQISGFSVQANGQVAGIDTVYYHSPSRMVVIGLTDQLTKDDTITVSYSGNDIVSADTIKLAPFSNALIENLLPGSSPRLLSARTSYDGEKIQLAFNKKINPSSVSTASFTIRDSGADTLIKIDDIGILNGDSTSIDLGLVGRVFLENTLELNYSGSDVKSIDNGFLKTIASFKITNESQGITPNIVAARLINQGLGIELVFNKTLKNMSGQKQFFSLKINNQNLPISSLSNDNENLHFILNHPVRHADEVVVDFSGGVIRATDDAELTEIKSLSIANDLPAPVFQNIPFKVEAEKYTIQYGVQTQGTSDAGGGLNVGWIDASDWMDYAIDVPEAGSFNVDFRVSGQSDGKIMVQITDGPLLIDLKTVSFPSTGGWQNWTTVSTSFNLPKGKNYLRLKVLAGGFNLNWFQFTKSTIKGPELLSATLLSNAKSISLSFDKTLIRPVVADTAYFDVIADGVKYPLSKVNLSTTTSTLILILKSSIPADVNAITISYDGIAISSDDNGMLLPFNEFPVSTSTAVEKNKVYGEINIYPVPVNDRLYINAGIFKPVSAQIIDMDGKVTLEVDLSGAGNTVEIPVNLDNGNYIVVLKNQHGEQISQRLTVSKQ